MPRLIYAATASLDGYVADREGRFDWAARAVDDPAQPAGGQDFARIWQAADKVVFSRTLDAVTAARTCA